MTCNVKFNCEIECKCLEKGEIVGYNPIPEDIQNKNECYTLQEKCIDNNEGNCSQVFWECNDKIRYEPIYGCKEAVPK